MTIKVYGIKNCDSCRKAVKALEAAGAEFSFHDLREAGVSRAQINRWAKAVGREKLLNTRSTTWRGLPDKDKSGVDDAKAVALMEANPTLIKRPVVELPGNKIVVGWTRESEQAALAG